PEVAEAARTLLQWARTRQATWRDPSADLLAALGNRHHHLQAAAPADTTAPLPHPPAPLPVPQARVAPETPPAFASPAPPPPLWPADPKPAPPATPTLADPPRALTSPVVEPPAAPARTESERASRAPAGMRWMPWAAAAAAVVLAAIAVPRVWRTYAPATAAAPKPGMLSLDSTPAGSTVLIDGVEAGTTPLQKELPAGPHTIEFRYKKGSRTIDVTVVSGESATGSVDWSRKPVGRLHVTSDTANTKVLVDGKARGTAPVTIDNLAAGAHVVTLQSAQGSVRQSVAIKEGATAELAGSIYPGSLHVSAPFEVQITEQGRLLRLDDRNQAVLPPGPHKLRVVSAAYGLDEVRTVDVQPGKLASLQIAAPAAPAAPAAAPAEPAATAADAPTEGVMVPDPPSTLTPEVAAPPDATAVDPAAFGPAAAEPR
ncbi:MAG: PEGA domain-containing protein, partial [Vicinamibacterales bacterium]